MSAIDTIIARIRTLQDELEAEIARRRAAFRYRLENNKVVFEREALLAHRRARVRLLEFLKATRPLVVLTAPVIYALIVPFALLDLFVWVYQAVCFPVYGIPKVPRRAYPHRPAQAGLSQRPAEAQLRLLRLLQRRDCPCARGGRAHRSLLVPDQTCRWGKGSTSALCRFRGFRRCRGLYRRRCGAACQGDAGRKVNFPCRSALPGARTAVGRCPTRRDISDQRKRWIRRS